ncbi:MAG: hypothetical protein WCK64_09085 [Synechococcaceae cyanobacterium ELA445]
MLADSGGARGTIDLHGPSSHCCARPTLIRRSCLCHTFGVIAFL